LAHLLKGIPSSQITRIVNIIHVCCILHNICINLNDVLNDDEVEGWEREDDSQIVERTTAALYVDNDDEILRRTQGQKRRDELADMLVAD